MFDDEKGGAKETRDPETTHPYRPESDDVTSGAPGQASVGGGVNESAQKLR